MRNTGHPAGSWYAQTATPFPAQPPLAGEARTQVCIVGGGYTGLGAALELASRSVEVRLLETASVGSGGSGRNGGQLHTGQRREQEWLERAVGPTDALALWALAERARESLLGLIVQHAIDCDLRHGVIHARHRARDEAWDLRHVERMARVYGYRALEPVGREALAEILGTDVYHGGVIDRGGGHLHPLNLALGLARAALAAGAVIHEGSHVESWRRTAAGIEVATAQGRVACEQLILTGDGYFAGLSAAVETRVLPINNFIATTEPLGDAAAEILRGDLAAADSRFVVNYFRKTADGRLLFGGGETYSDGFPADVAALVRKHMLKIYPRLAGVRITHAWGGTLGVTRTRVPFVGEVAPGVFAAAGYSGQGVLLAPYFGKLLAAATLGDRSGVELLALLPTPPFPGGRRWRRPVLAAGLGWYALRDRLG
jgi:gamma-glutamylputrescine oxidase